MQGRLASVRLDRRVDGVYGAWARVDDTVETLATGNVYLFLLSLGQGPGPEGLDFHRWLDPLERAPLMGISPGRLQCLTKAQVVKVTGNAYPVPMVGSVLHSVLTATYNPSAVSIPRPMPDRRPQLMRMRVVLEAEMVVVVQAARPAEEEVRRRRARRRNG